MKRLSDVSALIHDLGNRLISGATATETLLTWCEEHGLSQGPVTAECHQRLMLPTVDDKVREALRPTAGETIRYRRVRLKRGELPLAEAENWFVPERLGPGMVHALDTTNEPFGAVIASLNPARRILTLHISSSRSGQDAQPSQHLCVLEGDRTSIILQSTAVVLDDAGRSLAFVKEAYFSSLVQLPTSAPKRQDGGRSQRTVVTSSV